MSRLLYQGVEGVTDKSEMIKAAGNKSRAAATLTTRPLFTEHSSRS